MSKNRTILPPKPIFWILQFLGWGFLIFLGVSEELVSKGFVSYRTTVSSLIIGIGSILLTSLFRLIILRKNWLRLPFPRMIIKFLIWSGILAIPFYLYMILGLVIFSFEVNLTLADITSQLLSNFIIFFIWSLFYSTYFFIQNSRLQELNNLRLLSAQKDMELSVLKSQLNPHFMFNSLNSIRALIDEDPVVAKNSITQLSNILRNTLVLGQEKFIYLEDELKIVTDYLNIEKVRFEERLETEFNIDEKTKRIKIPPFLIQTFVENGIKHGISKLTKGGTIIINTKKVEGSLIIKVINDGIYDKDKPSVTGIGLTNLKKRLALIYPNYSLSIENKAHKVVTTLSIPASN